MLAEFAGTTVLLLVEVLLVRWLFGPRSAAAPALPEFVVRLTVIASVTGIVVGLLIVSPVGRSSGGHFNPAVTATFWLLRGLPGVDAAAFIGAQLVGSVAGVLAGRGLVGPVAADPRVRYAAIRPAAGWSWVGVFVGEAVSLAVLMLLVVVFLTSERLAPWTPLAVGACVALLIVVGGLTSGGSFNPARQFGPAVMAGEWSLLSAYLAGPLIGAVVAARTACRVVRGAPIPCGLCGGQPRDLPPPAKLAAGCFRPASS